VTDRTLAVFLLASTRLGLPLAARAGQQPRMQVGVRFKESVLCTNKSEQQRHKRKASLPRSLRTAPHSRVIACSLSCVRFLMFCVCLFTAFEYLVMVSCLSETQACLGKFPSDTVIQGDMCKTGLFLCTRVTFLAQESKVGVNGARTSAQTPIECGRRRLPCPCALLPISLLATAQARRRVKKEARSSLSSSSESSTIQNLLRTEEFAPRAL